MERNNQYQNIQNKIAGRSRLLDGYDYHFHEETDQNLNITTGAKLNLMF